MKWKDLSLKERKQIYDSVRVNNPGATYFDIKEQFDSIPAYEDGKNSESDQAWKINETVRLGMEGKPVPQDSLQHIIDRARMQNKPRSYDSTVGAIEQGKQVLSGLNKTVGTAATGASLLTMGGWNLLRTLGLGKGTPYRLWASKNALTGAKAGLAADAAQFVEDPNIDNGLQTAISLFPLGPKGYIDPKTQITGLLESVGDVKDLVPAYEDGKGKTINKEDLPPEYRTGTPEYFERQRKISGAVNTVQPEAYSSAELRKMGLFDAAGSRSYLLNPTEAKSHMLTLKRSLKDSGKITNWSTPVDENMILEYMRNPTSNKMVKNQYDLYRNKNEYIDRLNKLIPMEILMPLGGAGFVGHELNKE